MDPIMQAKESARRCQGRLLKTFEATHDDKVGWSVSSTSKSPLDIVNHVAETNFFFAKVLTGEPLPQMNSIEAADEHMKVATSGVITTREQAVAHLDKSVDALTAAISTLTPADLGKDVTLPFATLNMTFVMFLSAQHMENHAAQIDYIQTIYGDLENHI